MNYEEDLKFQGMEYVYAVYKEGGFSKAAKSLYISQPSLSASVKRVEARIGFPVFDRSSKSLKLTEPGEAYIAAVEQIMAIQNQFGDYMNDWNDVQTGDLTLGGSTLFASWFLPAMMQQYSEKYPKVNLKLIEESTPELIEMLGQEKIDIMLDNCDLNPQEYYRRNYQEERLYLAVPKAYEENEKYMAYAISHSAIQVMRPDNPNLKCIPLDAFAKRSFVMLKKENDTRIRAERLCHRAGFEPKILFEVDQQMTAYNITLAGFGISFVSDALLKFSGKSEKVVYYALPKELSCRALYFYWKKNRYTTRAMDSFLNLFLQL